MCKSSMFTYGVSIMWLYKYSHVHFKLIVQIGVAFMSLLGDLNIYTAMVSLRYFKDLKLD